MRRRFCDECGGEITFSAVDTLVCETSQESNTSGYSFQIKVEGIDLCHPCLVKLAAHPLNTICKRESDE